MHAQDAVALSAKVSKVTAKLHSVHQSVIETGAGVSNGRLNSSFSGIQPVSPTVARQVSVDDLRHQEIQQVVAGMYVVAPFAALPPPRLIGAACGTRVGARVT